MTSRTIKALAGGNAGPKGGFGAPDKAAIEKRLKKLEDTMRGFDGKDLAKRIKTLETTVNSLMNASKAGGGSRAIDKDISDLKEKIKKQEAKASSIDRRDSDGEKKLKSLEKRKEMLENAVKSLNVKHAKREKEEDAERVKIHKEAEAIKKKMEADAKKYADETKKIQDDLKKKVDEQILEHRLKTLEAMVKTALSMASGKR